MVNTKTVKDWSEKLFVQQPCTYLLPVLAFLYKYDIFTGSMYICWRQKKMQNINKLPRSLVINYFLLDI